VHLSCDFAYPAKLDDRLRVAAYFTAFGRSSIRLSFDVVHLDAQVLAAAGEEVLVCTDRRTRRPMVLPEELRAALERFALQRADARQALGLESGAET